MNWVFANIASFYLDSRQRDATNEVCLLLKTCRSGFMLR